MACHHASLLSDAAFDWLVNGGVIMREQRGTLERSFAASAIAWCGMSTASG